MTAVAVKSGSEKNRRHIDARAAACYSGITYARNGVNPISKNPPRIPFRPGDELDERLTEYSEKHKLSKNSILIFALTRYLDEEEAKKSGGDRS